jgi:glycosyltransferase involved in cell wall biosynthesis
MYSLSAIVPFYNEEMFIKESVTRLLETNLFDEVILVDDNSNDQSANIAKEIEKKYKIVKYYKKDLNEGKGSALILGYKKVSSSHIIVHDADLEYEPTDIQNLKELSIQNPKSLILGSRNLGNISRKKRYKYLVIGNKFITKFFSLINNVSISDISTCYMIYSKRFIESIVLNEKKFGIEIEILSKFVKTGNNIFEIPINYSGRSYKEGKKITFKDGIGIFFKVFKYKFL